MSSHLFGVFSLLLCALPRYLPTGFEPCRVWVVVDLPVDCEVLEGELLLAGWVGWSGFGLGHAMCL